ncbi:adenylate/guanylate cyclase domain-containing protein [Caldimonas tepidiphila]|uniref:adenylate/guanylate cyclase domain-containing protein n=1 Tax=Caldimonas tepidiphila TaxID=2315841 RepID=UPI0014735635|nr:adenylate/guanylate cyclase domain-containing protein [Caldimonas tepidiphila]
MHAASVHRTILFADLRGSTLLFRALGNAGAAELLAHTVSLLSMRTGECGGVVVKTLGDGLMALFATPAAAMQAVQQMQESIARITASAGPDAPALRLHVALHDGEVVEVDQDCFGDAIHIAARLLEHAGDDEVLLTQAVHARLDAAQQRRFRDLGPLQLRGIAEPVRVFQLTGTRAAEDQEPTGYAELSVPAMAGKVRLVYGPTEHVFSARQTPIVLGRASSSSFCVPEGCVSRSHARIEWHGGHFHFWDHSSNGSFVVFANGTQLAVRRASCSLHGSGTLGLGGTSMEQAAARVQFEVLPGGDTQLGTLL